MPLPSIHTIRISLAEIDGALVDDPATSPVDTGKIPCVQIHPEGGVQPTDGSLGRTPSDDESDETDTDEASIIFEIPHDRQVREALSQHPGRDFERLDPYLNDLLQKYCEAALADRRGHMSQFRTRVENAISSPSASKASSRSEHMLRV
jgi:hypothetical protein